MSKQSASNGFAPIIFLVGILIASGLIVGGSFYIKNSQAPKPAVISPTPKVDETANWKTYTNIKGGYSVKYPQKWNQLEDEASYFSPFEIKFIDGPPAPIWIYIELESDLQLITNKYKNLEGRQDFKEEKVAVDDVESVKLSGVIKSGYLNGTLNVEVFIPKGGKIIHISYYEIEEAVPVGIFDQILSTFKFLDQNDSRELIKATDVYQKGQIDKYDLELLSNFSWPKLKPFKSSDKTRGVYLVDCKVTNSSPWVELIGITTEVPNVPNIAEVTLKKLVENHYGGFPNKESIAGLEKTYNVQYKNADSGINGVLLKDGNLIINFYDSVAAYGGGSAAVQCLDLSTELTAKQFPTIKSVTMCIDKYGDKYNCSLDFQP